MAEAKEVASGIEAGHGAYIPPPPTITIWVENHPKISKKVVGDTVRLEIAAHVTEYDSDGRYRLEFDNIDIQEEDPKKKLIKKASSEIFHIGSLSPESLNSIFSASQKEKED